MFNAKIVFPGALRRERKRDGLNWEHTFYCINFQENILLGDIRFHYTTEVFYLTDTFVYIIICQTPGKSLLKLQIKMEQMIVYRNKLRKPVDTT